MAEQIESHTNITIDESSPIDQTPHASTQFGSKSSDQDDEDFKSTYEGSATSSSYFEREIPSRQAVDKRSAEQVANYTTPEEDIISTIKENCDIFAKIHLKEMDESIVGKLYLSLLKMKSDATVLFKRYNDKNDSREKSVALKIIQRLNDYTKQIAARTNEFKDKKTKESKFDPRYKEYSEFAESPIPYQHTENISNRSNYNQYEASNNNNQNTQQSSDLRGQWAFESNINQQQSQRQQQQYQYPPQKIEAQRYSANVNPQSVSVTQTKQVDPSAPTVSNQYLRQESSTDPRGATTYTPSALSKPKAKGMENIKFTPHIKPTTKPLQQSEELKSADIPSEKKTETATILASETKLTDMATKQKADFTTQRKETSKQISSPNRNVTSKHVEKQLKQTTVYIQLSTFAKSAEPSLFLSYASRTDLKHYHSQKTISLQVMLYDDDTHFYVKTPVAATTNTYFPYRGRAPDVSGEDMYEIWFDTWYTFPEFQSDKVVITNKGFVKETTTRNDKDEFHFIGNLKTQMANEKNLFIGVVYEIIGVTLSGMQLTQFYTEDMYEQFLKMNVRLSYFRVKKHTIIKPS